MNILKISSDVGRKFEKASQNVTSCSMLCNGIVIGS